MRLNADTFRINTFTLKLIATAAMLCDHVAAVFISPSSAWYLALRGFGRIAFPIFAYELTEGFYHTRSVKRYLMRLSVLAIISEVPFDLLFYGKPFESGAQNVYLTLFIGLLMMYVMSRVRHVVFKCLTAVLFAAAAYFLKCDYSVLGVLMILCFYVFRERRLIRAASIALLNVGVAGGLQSFGTMALIPVSLHNGRQGPKCGVFFYLFYPVHLTALFIIKQWLIAVT